MKLPVLFLSAALSALAGAEPAAAHASATNAVGNVRAAGQCHSVTKSGNRCKRKAAPDRLYCRQHAAAAIRQTAKTCCYLDDANVRCTESAVDGKRYCPKHLPPSAAKEQPPVAKPAAE